jgi:exodeoxyribonuclease-5
MSDDIILSDEQGCGVHKFAHWFTHERRWRQVFHWNGYAGTGKTTAISYAIEELGLPRHRVVYCTFTMKAALILRRTGLPASTIHKLIYKPVEPSPEAYQRARKQLAALRERCPEVMPRDLWLRKIRDLELQLHDIRSLKFVINEESKLREAALCVVDECSMVGQDLADDLLAFGVPTLVVGDPGQLPPVKGGRSPFDCATPDVMLTEPHRFALESPIVRLSIMARRGEHIPFGRYGSTCAKLPFRARSAEDLLEADIVIIGKHITRYRLNNELKAAAGFPEPLPLGRGEKLIGMRNSYTKGLYNGQFLEVRNIAASDAISFQADIVTEDGDLVEQAWLYTGHFEDHVRLDKEREARDCFERRGLVETDWGYAITAHKAQGSGFENVVVVDDGWGHWDRRLRARWLYTAITRAADSLTLLQA